MGSSCADAWRCSWQFVAHQALLVALRTSRQALLVVELLLLLLLCQ